ETAVYLATSPKSNSTYKAIGKAQEMVAKTGNLPVPLHLRNAPTKLMKELGYGRDYNYPHDQPGHFLEEEYLPDQISGTKFWEPDENIKERDLREKMRKLWSDRYTY
ncbi:MAG: replication-associated recombination protein A, partial [Bacteroidales bacterium]|nr:replication-associated recombination protein A [Bacteroidales bacterium]